MALITASVQNGQVVETDTTGKSTSAASKSQSGLDKEAFLQLLIAQMQYQDPLEPMDNTEYISQLATFSQLEATQNLADTVNNQYASSLVGKYVILNTDYGSVHGKVDYVMYENGNILLAVNDGLYSLEDLDTVADSTYYEAFEMANVFSSLMASLPSAKDFSSANMSAFEQVKAVLEAMTAYQQSFISDDDIQKYKDLLAIYNQLKNASSGNNTPAGDDPVTDGDGQDVDSTEPTPGGDDDLTDG